MSCSKKNFNSIYDIAIIGAGAAGLFCAALAAARGKKVVLIDHRHRVAEKIRISGGGRCNFTNIHSRPENFLSSNPHFVKSALASFTPQDFIALVERYHIPYHEKKLGQLFCNNSAQDIIDMLLAECRTHQVETAFGLGVAGVKRGLSGFEITSEEGGIRTDKLVVATGGLSIPKIGATGFGYQLAEQFNLAVIPPRAGLVPLTFTDQMKDFCASLSGLSVEAEVFFGKSCFAEGLLFTHRGLSGPSILQISSYWQSGQDIRINLAPHQDIANFLITQKKQARAATLPVFWVSFCQNVSLGRWLTLPPEMAAWPILRTGCWQMLATQSIAGISAPLVQKAIARPRLHWAGWIQARYLPAICRSNPVRVCILLARW